MLQNLREKINSNQKGWHYIAYCLSFMCMGAAVSALGPLIPYLAQTSKRSEAEYSFLFLSRALGFITSGFAVKFIQKKLVFHQILKYSSIIILVFMFCFSNFNNLYLQAFFNFFISILLCQIMIIINVSIMQIQKNHYQQEWLNFSHGIFSIGGLVGPILVRYFEQSTFFLIGLAFTLISPVYHFLQTPQDHAKISQKLAYQEAIQQLQNVNHQGVIKRQKSFKVTKKIPQNIQKLMCFMFFLYIGIQVTFGGWISPYAVLSKVSRKDQATIFSSLFFITITIFRFVFCALSSSSSKKLDFLFKSLAISSFFIVILISINQIYLACLLSSLLFGACVSSMFALMLSVPWQYGYQINAKQSGKFMLFSSFGEGTLSMIVGYLMSLIDLNILFYMILISSVVLKLSYNYIIKIFQDDKNSPNPQKQLTNIMLK